MIMRYKHVGKWVQMVDSCFENLSGTLNLEEDPQISTFGTDFMML